MVESLLMEITSTRSLLEALDTRGTTAEARKSFDEEVWKQCGVQGAILVTDLTGFTKSTQRHGILQFLAVFRRVQKTCGPVLGKHGGELLKQEADDLFGVFPETQQALEAAFEMLRTVETLNENLDPDDQMGLSVGVDYGRFIRLSDDAYGDPVNVAFKLGEDIAQTGEVRVGRTAFEQAQKEGWSSQELSVEGPIESNKSGAATGHYIIRL